jgi:hypothetical protein
VTNISETKELSGTLKKPTAGQLKYLAAGLTQPGGKLPLFDKNGQRISRRTVESCVEKGWAKPWFKNLIKPHWQVCKLTQPGRDILKQSS